MANNSFGSQLTDAKKILKVRDPESFEFLFHKSNSYLTFNSSHSAVSYHHLTTMNLFEVIKNLSISSVSDIAATIQQEFIF
jgi:hypothetical protein